jgi:hypothetical protein
MSGLRPAWARSTEETGELVSQYIPTEQIVLAPWDRMVRLLAGRGWAAVPGAIRPLLIVQLAASAPSSILAQLPASAPSSILAQLPASAPSSILAQLPAAAPSSILAQLPASAPTADPAATWTQTLPLAEAPHLLQDLALRLAASLSVAAELQRLATIPLFGGATWICQREPSPSPFWVGDVAEVGVTAMICLSGTAIVQALSVRRPSAPGRLSTGGLVLVRRDGWPRAGWRGLRPQLETENRGPVLIVVLGSRSG